MWTLLSTKYTWFLLNTQLTDTLHRRFSLLHTDVGFVYVCECMCVQAWAHTSTLPFVFLKVTQEARDQQYISADIWNYSVMKYALILLRYKLFPTSAMLLSVPIKDLENYFVLTNSFQSSYRNTKDPISSPQLQQRTKYSSLFVDNKINKQNAA